jgi:hypothetical protein
MFADYSMMIAFDQVTRMLVMLGDDGRNVDD